MLAAIEPCHSTATINNPNCLNCSPMDTDTVMANDSNNMPSRLMRVFADNAGSNVVAQH
jgi:hypothetical protein